MIGYFLSLISFCLLSMFSLLYLSSAIPKKPPVVEKALTFIKTHLNYLAMGGAIYGFVAFCLAVMMIPVPLIKVVAMGAGLMLIVMALPFVFDKLVAKYEGKANTAILKELRTSVSMVTQNEVVIGIVGALLAAAIFVTTFVH